jgi:hypothetical protein
VARELRDKLMEKREWDEDGSTVRDFLMRQIQKEQGKVAPVFERPGPPFDLPSPQGPSGFSPETGEEGAAVEGTSEGGS